MRHARHSIQDRVTRTRAAGAPPAIAARGARPLLALLAGLCLVAACASPPPAPVPVPVQPPPDPHRLSVQRPLQPGFAPADGRLVRVALLAPFSSASEAVREEADTLAAAAELALFETGARDVLLMPRDSGDTPESARQAAVAAIEEGADVILGPLFASGVGAIAPYARANRVTAISFSTDVSEAGRGIYALTVLPEDEAQRVVAYAARNGVRRLAVLAPQGRYGDRVVEAAEAAARAAGVEWLGAVRWEPQAQGLEAAEAAARRAAALTAGARARDTAMLIPERGALLRALARALSDAGAPASRVRYLGTGLWNDPDTLTDPRLAGGWHVMPDAASRPDFDRRFAAAFGRRPTRLAGLGYDATALVARLVAAGGKPALQPLSMEASEGFAGVDGRFRFDNGVARRAFSIGEAGPRGSRVIDPAPGRFSP